MLILVRLSGGLGNQIFQFAKGLSLSKTHSCKVLFIHKEFAGETSRSISISDFMLIDFQICHKYELPFIRINYFYYAVLKYFYNFKIIRELDPKSLKNNLNSKNNYFFDGYWQETETISRVKHDLKESLQLIKPVSSNFNFYKTLIQSNVESVSLHIRKTDFLKGKNRTIFCEIDSSYYMRAINYLTEVVSGDLVYFIFGDDVQWFKENISLSAQKFFIINNNPSEDLVLMSLCKYNITSNSTFSFWGAWLNVKSDRIIITPEHWKQDQDVSFIPADWVKV
jgi:hypothetical protein